MTRFKRPPLSPGTELSVRYGFDWVEKSLKAERTVDVRFAAHAGLGHTLLHAAAALLGSSPNATRGFGLTGMTAFGSLTSNPMHLIYLDSADWAVSGMAAKLKVGGTCVVNATAPGAALDFALGLYPISSVAGATGGVAYTAGTVVGSSSFTFNSGTALAASTRYEGETAAFSFPSTGWYALAMNQTGGTSAAANHMHFTGRLSVLHV